MVKVKVNLLYSSWSKSRSSSYVVNCQSKGKVNDIVNDQRKG